ncbi:MAG: leucine-rich repeat domain-containing protein [Chitinivibrionia bacterium]|nr:leucine-rich repeat domain-containing protein [Chitinivibrionia bacterium]
MPLTSVVIPNSVITIGVGAFSGSNLKEITIPNSVTRIERSAFLGNTNLTTLNLNADNVSFGWEAFGNTPNLTRLNIGAQVATRPVRELLRLPNLTYISVDAQNIALSSYDGVLFSKERDTLMRFPNGRQGAYVIPNSVNTIGTIAFEAATLLTEVTIPNSVNTIGTMAFEAATLLTEVTIPNSVTSIGDRAFASMPNLTTVNFNAVNIAHNRLLFSGSNSITQVNIGDQVTRIPGSAFSRLTNLTEIIIPNSVVSIGSRAFEMTGLTKATIGNSVSSIEDMAFSNTNLTEITIPNSVIDIGNSAFANTNLTEITIPNSVIDIGNSAFANTNLTDVSIPNSVTSIGREAFANNTSLKTVYFNANLTSVGWGMFSGANSIARVNFGDEVTTIPSIFRGVNSLQEVILGNSVTTIENFAFENTGLTEITIPNSVTTIGYAAFRGTPNLTTVNFNAENITNMAGNVWRISNHVSELFNTSITTINIGDNVTVIPANAFVDLRGINEIVIPNSVTTIGSRAFDGATNLTEITIPNSVIDIGNSAFANTNLTEVSIPNSVTTIGNGAFDGATNLKEITIGNSVTSIAPYAFVRTGLRIVNFNSKNMVEAMNLVWGEGESNIPAIIQVNIGDSVKVIPSNAFRNLSELTEVVIPNSVTRIGAMAFANTGLTEITIPSSVADIEYRAFWGTSLTLVRNTAESPQRISQDVFLDLDIASATLFVPYESLVAYRMAPIWQDFGNIVALIYDWSEWSEWRTTVMASCVLAGSRERIRICRTHSIQDREIEVIPTLNHSFLETWTTITPATCNTAGLERRECSRFATCGHYETRPIAPQPCGGTYCNICNPKCGNYPRTCGRSDCNEPHSCNDENCMICRPNSIRPRETENRQYGIILEENPVSDSAVIFIRTPEQATITLRILDNLGNVVFTETAAYGRVGRQGLHFVSNPPIQNAVDNAIIWNLTNPSGRFVANGTYLVVVEATGISGKVYRYSARIGVNR